MNEYAGLYDPSHERDACGIGLVARLDGASEHRTIADGLSILRNLEHRGAVSGDGRTGDGAGLLCRIPDAFFRRELGGILPPGDAAGETGLQDGLPYAIGMFFMPGGVAAGKTATNLVEYIASREGIGLLGWREVPVVPQVLGDRARAGMPHIVQAAFARPEDLAGPGYGQEFERRLYVFRKNLEGEARAAGFALDEFSIPSLSSRTIVYKGMFVAAQFESFYPDLGRQDFASPFSVVHQRYSTNTVPSWPLAQPFRMISHNGEINTLRKNVNAMKARQSTLVSPLFGKDLSKLFPVIEEKGSDSAMFDNVFELLVRAGRSPQHAFMMMVPEPVETLGPSPKRDFYEYHAAMMEAWDGPAAMVFTDGATIGAASDRNGLRPFRYALTADGRFVGASEAGALELDASLVVENGKLEPGKMLLLDLANARVLRDDEVKNQVCSRQPYGKWLAERVVEIPGQDDLGAGSPKTAATPESSSLDVYFGLDESARKVIEPMLATGTEATSAMGTKKAPAILSDQPRQLFDYFKQLFAQVTNPPMDSIREGVAMSLSGFVGRERNLLDETPLHCAQLKLVNPILSNAELERLRAMQRDDFRVCTVSTVYPLAVEGEPTTPAPGSRLKAAMEAVRTAVELRVDEGYSLVILSDRGMGEGKLAVPALLAVAAAHRRLVQTGKRHMTGLAIETGEAREIHHASLLVAYGASAVNPWLVFERMGVLASRIQVGTAALDVGTATHNYTKAIMKGMKKTMSKMGVSTIGSYRGGGLYEAVGLSRQLVDELFPGTESRIGGIGMAEMEADLLARHQTAFSGRSTAGADGGNGVSSSGELARETSLAIEASREVPWPPRLTALLTKAVRDDDSAAFRQYSDGISSAARPAFALRDLFEFRPGTPVPLDQVQSWQSLVSRFTIAAMSCGALSPEAHEALAAGANAVGSWSDSGEGGEDEARDERGADGIDRSSASRQIASARFGVDARYVARAGELQIKAAQGAKPGEGGQLPGEKVDAYIAKLRHAAPGSTLISPPPHHDIYSIEDLAQLVHDLRCANPGARVAIKLAAQAGIGAVAAGTAKAGVDCVIVSAGDGGTGSAPLSSLDYAGNAWELALPEVRQVLSMNGLLERVSIQVDGRLRSGRDVVMATILGAGEFAFGTAAMMAVGCIACGQCDRDRCPVGITTQKPELRDRFTGKPEHVVRFLRMMAEDTRQVLALIGAKSLEEVTGRHELLDYRGRSRSARDGLLDFTRITESLELAKRYQAIEPDGDDGSGPLVIPPAPAGLAAWKATWRAPFPAPEPDADLLAPVLAALEQHSPGHDLQNQWSSKQKTPLMVAVGGVRVLRNSDRSIGAALSGELVRQGLDAAPVQVSVAFSGSAGQSFGAFLVASLRFDLAGQANDFVGKGLSGGTISVRPPKERQFVAEDNVIAGNVCLFGATAGSLFLNGRVGERFAVRNSGALAVVEGVGDHACEYMTGGRVVILGSTGGNLCAGMTGGAVFVLDEDGSLAGKRAADAPLARLVVETADLSALRADIEAHFKATGSGRAEAVLADWPRWQNHFKKLGA